MENITEMWKQNGVTVSSETSTVTGRTDALTYSQYIFYISIRGVLHYTIQVVTTILNISTAIAIKRTKKLHVASNALFISLSLGHCLAGVSGTLSLATDFFLDNDGNSWKIGCTIRIYLVTLQNFIDQISIVAINIERAYSTYFPFQARKYFSFKLMQYVGIFIWVYSLIHVSTITALGFVKENFKYRAFCIFLTVFGRTVSTYGEILPFGIFSIVSLFMTCLLMVKLIRLKRKQKCSSSNVSSQREYKITKMLVTGKWQHKTMISDFGRELYCAY